MLVLYDLCIVGVFSPKVYGIYDTAIWYRYIGYLFTCTVIRSIEENCPRNMNQMIGKVAQLMSYCTTICVYHGAGCIKLTNIVDFLVTNRVTI